MTDTPRYHRVADGFSRAVASIGDDQWTLPTPDDEWDVTALVTHVIGVHRRIAAMVEPDQPTDVGEDEDLREAWSQATATIVRLIADRAAASMSVPSRGGEQAFGALVAGLLCADTLCHTWDLARAIGADESLDKEAVQSAHRRLRDAGDAIRVPGGFAAAIEPAHGASAQTKFLNFTGRRV